MHQSDYNSQVAETSCKPLVSNNETSNKQLVTNDQEVSLLELLLVLARYWKMMIVGAVVAGIIAAVLSLCMPNIYTAKTMILPSVDDNGGIGAMMMAQLGGLAGLAGGLGSPTKSELYVTMLKSETVKDPIIDRFKLMNIYKAKFRAVAYASLDKNSIISTGKKDGVITIAVSDKNPELAASIANAYVEELGKLSAKLNMTGAGQNRAFLEGRLGKAKADLVVAEERLKTFQTENKTIAVTDQAKAALEGVAQLRAQLVAQEVQLGVLQRQFTDSSQEVMTAKTSIANLRRQIDKFEGKGDGGSVPGVGSMPRLGQEYVRLMREYKIQETLVELLTKQYEINKLNEVKDVSPFQVLQQAKVPEIKSQPKRSIIVVLATFSGGFLILLMAFIRESARRMSDEELNKWQELQRLLPLPRIFRNRKSE